MTEMTVLDKTVALLAEVNPAVAAAVEEIGGNSVGHPLVGRWGWMPPVDLLDACKAVCLAYGRTALPEGYHWDYQPEELAQGVRAAYSHVQDPENRIVAGIQAWSVVRLGTRRIANWPVTS